MTLGLKVPQLGDLGGKKINELTVQFGGLTSKRYISDKDVH
jgi:hypothetical protein